MLKFYRDYSSPFKLNGIKFSNVRLSVCFVSIEVFRLCFTRKLLPYIFSFYSSGPNPRLYYFYAVIIFGCHISIVKPK